MTTIPAYKARRFLLNDLTRTMTSTTHEKTRVLIVGAGAAGLSAAYALSQHPDRYDVRVYERSSNPGGMATSVPIDRSKYGADYINDGVQGASPVFYNTYAMFNKLGFSATDVNMQVSFGRDEETEFWTNVFPSKVIDKFSSDIKRFGKVLKIIKMFEGAFAMISVNAMLKMFRFSKEFGDAIVYPLVALFFGTGNQTPFISSAILERVFMDPNMRLFEFSPETFLATIPKMKAFPRLSMLYDSWKSFIEDQGQGSVKVVLEREVTRIKRHPRSKGAVQVWSRLTKGTNSEQEVISPGEEEIEEIDEIIFCTDADAALKILRNDASWMEKRVLGNVKYLWDITVTHNDLEYMKKYYRVRYDPMLRSERNQDDPERKKQFEFAEKNFAPLYYIRSYLQDRSKLEMSFDLTCYQPQFDGVSPFGPEADVMEGNSKDGNPEGEGKIPLEQHVFQTIFLNKDPESSQYWSKDEIDFDKIIMQKWWKQQSHRWQHYAGTVPWMGLINGKNHTYFAGAWTILNMHEIAVVSGFAAAYRLGAAYPFSENADCKRLFTLCLATNHMSRLRKEDRTGIFA
ncbi:hypothetical protein AX15_000564 [Amanita polypyramis BW_CC]|nr:hypothetical protein AX15_000564 [Amanita polypyramis BW_CC]